MRFWSCRSVFLIPVTMKFNHYVCFNFNWPLDVIRIVKCSQTAKCRRDFDKMKFPTNFHVFYKLFRIIQARKHAYLFENISFQWFIYHVLGSLLNMTASVFQPSFEIWTKLIKLPYSLKFWPSFNFGTRMDENYRIQ